MSERIPSVSQAKSRLGRERPICYHRGVDNIGRKWQKETAHHRNRPPTARTTVEPGKTVELPIPETLDLHLGEALERRRSGRNYSGKPLTAKALASLVWAACGINDRRGRLQMRTAPSAGATYPIELYNVIGACREIEPGLYRYDAPSHSLVGLGSGDLSGATASALLDQNFVAKAAAVFVWTAIIARCEHRYDRRAYRYVYLEAGHQAQNVLLASAALELAACPIGAFFDDELSALLGIDGAAEIPLYTVTVGHPA